MVTGDALAIAKETAKQLGMGTNILDAGSLGDSKKQESAEVTASIEKADGFAEVFPEHKFHIVDVLQKLGHIVGMTGDGVNDAPALKKADCGFAVSTATDAARAAASIVLTTPGLSVIIDAIKESRRIFQRMNSYAIYRIAETLRVLLFMTASILIFNFFPLTAVMIVMLALLNDGAILSIAYDNVHYKDQPEAWNMRLVLGVATVLGVLGPDRRVRPVLLGRPGLPLDHTQLQPMMYLMLSVAGHMTIFLTRTRGPFWSIAPAPALWIACLGTQILATCIAVFGFLMPPLDWRWAAAVWGYALIWALLSDRIKLLAYRIFDSPKAAQAAKVKGIAARAKVEAKPDAHATAKPDAKVAAAPEVKAEAKPDAKVAAAPEVKAEAKPDAKVAAAPEVKAEAKPDANKVAPAPEVKAEAKPDANKVAPAPEVKAEAKPDANKVAPAPEVKAEAKPDANKVAPAPEVKAEAKPDANKVAPAPEVKAEAKPDAKAAPAPEAKAEAKPDAKAAPAPEVKVKTPSDLDPEAGRASPCTLRGARAPGRAGGPGIGASGKDLKGGGRPLGDRLETPVGVHGISTRRPLIQNAQTTLKGVKLKINSKDFRVRPPENGRTRQVADHCEALFQIEGGVSRTAGNTRRGFEFAATTSLCVRPLCVAADLSGHGRCRQGRRDPARHVRSQSARLPGFQFQATERRRAGTRFSLAHDLPASGTRADRHLQSFVL